MVRFRATVEYFTNNKDKTGWTYVVINKAQANKLNPGVRKSFRVKGTIDNHEVKQKSLLPASEDRFIFTLDAAIRKAIKKKPGDTVTLELELDKKPLKVSPDLLACLETEPIAEEFFKTLAPSHQRYFSNWIEEAKTETTRTKRLTMTLAALARKMDFGRMIRESQGKDY